MFVPVREYKLSVATTAPGSPQALNFTGLPKLGANCQVQLVATVDTVVKFGNSTVAAATTLTGGARADGNFTVPAGLPIPFAIKDDQTHVSFMSENGSATGSLFLTLGYGDDY